MSTPIEHIEKDYLLKWLYNEAIPLTYIRHTEIYYFTIQKYTKELIFLKADRPIPEVSIGERVELFFEVRGYRISCDFTINTKDPRAAVFMVGIPETLHRDLERSFFRVPFPDNLSLEFSFDEWYQLPCPKFIAFPVSQPSESEAKPRPLLSVISQLHQAAKEYTAGVKVVLFKDDQQNTLEEQILVKTGKILYLPSTKSSFIDHDPFLEKRIITKTILKTYLKSSGENPILLDMAIDRFLQALYSVGIFSAVWIPLFFQEYIIGYAHLWITTHTRIPLPHTSIEKILPLTRDLVAAMKGNGYFESHKIGQTYMYAQGINISPSGINFTFLSPTHIPVLRARGKTVIKLTFPQYVMEVSAEIVRWDMERFSITMVCHFLAMKKADLDYIFEFLYGRTLTDPTAALVAGMV